VQGLGCWRGAARSHPNGDWVPAFPFYESPSFSRWGEGNTNQGISRDSRRPETPKERMEAEKEGSPQRSMTPSIGPVTSHKLILTRAESRARVDGDGWVRLRWRREPKDTADVVGLSSRRMSDFRVACKQTRVLAHDASKPPLFMVLLFPTSDSRLPECLPSAGSEVGSRFHHSSIWIKVQLQHFSRHAQGS
jgi:hypothetical protein